MISKEEFVKAFQSMATGDMSAKDFARLTMQYFKSPDYNRWKAARASEDLKEWKAGRAKLLDLIEDARQRGFKIETETVTLRNGHDSVRVSLAGSAICFPSFYGPESIDLNWKTVEDMMARSKRAPCGRPDCAVSTSIDDVTLTFGGGDLDQFGYWEIPCAICAEAYQKDHPNQPVWPRKDAPKQG